MSQPLLTLPEIKDIEKEAKRSFYFLDLDIVEKNYLELKNAFQHFYPNTQIAYSFKTNYAPKICRLIKDLGGWAEVVSEMEYDIALSIGYLPENIIVNGPMHDQLFLERSLLDGALWNLDSWYLLQMVSEICKKYAEKNFEVGIRLTFPIREAGFSRFGIDATTENMQKIKAWESSLDNCKIIGFHSHYSNSSRSLISFSDRIEQMIKNTFLHFGKEIPKFLNIGGGLFGKMPESLAAQFNGNIPNYQEYAEVIAGRLKETFNGEKTPILFLEPGTAVVGDAMDFISKVHEVKNIDGQHYAIVDGSNHNINHKWGKKILPANICRNIEQVNGGSYTFKVVGNTCIEMDIMHRDLQGPISRGDYIVFPFTGGYTNVLKQPFIHPCQPIYARHKGEYFLVKRSEKMQDILATYL